MKFYLAIIAFLVGTHCHGGEVVTIGGSVTTPVETPHTTDVPAEAAPTPYPQIRKALWGILKLKNSDSFIDFGCGADARVVIAAKMGIHSQCYGVEIDPQRATQAGERVKRLGVDNVTIIESDATQIDVEKLGVNVGFAYLYPGVLERLKHNILKLDRFASYMHRVPGLPMEQIGDVWYWEKSMSERADVPEVGYWGGYAYSGRVCSRANCQMCNSIAGQIAAARQQNQSIAPKVKPAARQRQPGVNGQYVQVKYCNGKRCWYETEWRWYQ